jgi:hypothetical protein
LVCFVCLVQPNKPERPNKPDEPEQPDRPDEPDKPIELFRSCQLLRHLGFDERMRGSHHLFRKSGITELINLQREGSKAKVYQVRQVRAVLLKYRLAGEGGED